MSAIATGQVPRAAAPQKWLDGIPILDAEVIAHNPDFPGDADLVTVFCRFCGYQHRHGVRADIPVGALVHRLAHCPDHQRISTRSVQNPAGSYFLRIVRNRLLEDAA